MPKIADIDETPNPNAIKFTLREPLSWGVTYAFDNPEQAQANDLARALFAIPQVTNVFYVDRWITVTQDGKALWEDLTREIAAPIRAAPAAAAQSAAAVFEARAALVELSEADQARLNVFNQVLDQEIRPYLQSDGARAGRGNVLDNGLLYLKTVLSRAAHRALLAWGACHKHYYRACGGI